MDVLILYLSLCFIGYCIGAFLRRRSIVLKGAGVLQTIALVALVYVMGSRIGAEEEIVASLDTIGLKALAITLFIMAGTVLSAFAVRKLLGFDAKGNLVKGRASGAASETESDREKSQQLCKEDVVSADMKVSEGEAEAGSEKKEEKTDKTIVYCIFIPVIAGIISGLLFLPDSFIDISGTIIVVGLSVLLFFVGIDLGREGTIVQNFRTAGWRVLLFPFVMIAGTYIGAVAAGLIIDLSVKDAFCVASGFGWYTLAPAMLAEYSIEISAISFMHNVMRELLGILLLPVVAKKLGYIESTGLVGAGAMDVCLPIIVRTTSGNMAVYAFITGVVLSFSVPVMVSFMMGL